MSSRCRQEPGTEPASARPGRYNHRPPALPPAAACPACMACMQGPMLQVSWRPRRPDAAVPLRPFTPRSCRSANRTATGRTVPLPLLLPPPAASGRFSRLASYRSLACRPRARRGPFPRFLPSTRPSRLVFFAHRLHGRHLPGAAGRSRAPSICHAMHVRPMRACCFVSVLFFSFYTSLQS